MLSRKQLVLADKIRFLLKDIAKLNKGIYVNLVYSFTIKRIEVYICNCRDVDNNSFCKLLKLYLYAY